MISPAPWIDTLERELPRARAGEPEGVHQLRVAAGRLSVWLELSGRRMLRDDLRWLRARAARCRDLDVLLEGLGGEFWAAPLRSERAGEAAELARELDTARAAGLLRALRALPSQDEFAAARALGRLRARVHRAAARAFGRTSEPASLHRLRRRVRRLRYALEWLGRPAESVKALQDELGTLHDATLALERAVPAGEPAGAARAALAGRIEGGYARARELWKTYTLTRDED